MKECDLEAGTEAHPSPSTTVTSDVPFNASDSFSPKRNTAFYEGQARLACAPHSLIKATALVHI